MMDVMTVSTMVGPMAESKGAEKAAVRVAKMAEELVGM